MLKMEGLSLYKVLLVDDEVLIREAISENIEWNKLGYDFLGACKDGRQAIELIKKDPPDLVITDINMPYVDGIELTKYIYENYSDIKVIIISGYDEFEYAKQAVKYKVLEYVLKPVTAFELSEILTKVKTSFDEERRKNNNIKRIRGAYVSNLPVLKGRFLNNLIQGTPFTEEIQDKLEELGINLQGKYFAATLVEGDDLSVFTTQYPDTKNNLALFAIYNITDEIISSARCGITFQNVEDKTVVIFSGNFQEELIQEIDDICKKIQDSIHEYLQIETTICIGKIVSSVSKLHLSFDGIKSAMEYRFVLDGNQIFHSKDFELEKNAQPIDDIDISSAVGHIVINIKANNNDDIEDDIKNFIQILRDAYFSKNRTIIYIQNFILSVMKTVETAGINEDKIYEEERKLLNNIYEMKQLKDIETTLIEFCFLVADAMSSSRDSFIKKQALLALDYIDKNYGNPDINLNSVCNYLAMSTSYFSSIFKNYTGETFIESLTNKRIEKAKNLIANTNMKIYEIAIEVGFSDPHYFSIAFKKSTGRTPTEYGKHITDDSQ